MGLARYKKRRPWCVCNPTKKPDIIRKCTATLSPLLLCVQKTPKNTTIARLPWHYFIHSLASSLLCFFSSFSILLISPICVPITACAKIASFQLVQLCFRPLSCSSFFLFVQTSATSPLTHFEFSSWLQVSENLVERVRFVCVWNLGLGSDFFLKCFSRLTSSCVDFQVPECKLRSTCLLCT